MWSIKNLKQAQTLIDDFNNKILRHSNIIALVSMNTNTISNTTQQNMKEICYELL